MKYTKLELERVIRHLRFGTQDLSGEVKTLISYKDIAKFVGKSSAYVQQQCHKLLKP